MESSEIAIALSQLKQMTKKISGKFETCTNDIDSECRRFFVDDKKMKFIAAQKAIACGQVRPVSKELRIAPSTIRRYRKKLLVDSESSDSIANYSFSEEAMQEETVNVKEEQKPALKFTIEVRPNGKSLVCCKCKNSIDIKDLSTTKNPAADQNFQL